MKKPEWAGLHRSDSQGLLTPFLAAASALYRAGLALRPSVTPRRLSGFVLSVGNLAAGGTGKTPAVVMLARWALRQGYRTAVLTRGYGGTYRNPVLEVSSGSGLCSDAGSAGDEPCLLAESLPGVPVIAGRKRYSAGLYAENKFGSGFFILDDGFQHRALARDMDLVLMDAVHPWGNGHLLPRGPLREPLENLERADAVVLTRAGSGDNAEAVRYVLRSMGMSVPVFLADHVPSCVVDHLGVEHPVHCLDGIKVAAFAGIGNPASFNRTLEKLGAEVVNFSSFPDHHIFTAQELDRLERGRRDSGAEWLVTTEKDWIRIRTGPRPYPGTIRSLRIAFSLLQGSEGLLTTISERVEARGFHR